MCVRIATATPKPDPAQVRQGATAAGVPVPELSAVAAYYAELDVIDPGIRTGPRSEWALVSNSLSTCGALDRQGDPQQLLTQTVLSLSGEAALTRDQGTRVIDAIRHHLRPAIQRSSPPKGSP